MKNEETRLTGLDEVKHFYSTKIMFDKFFEYLRQVLDHGMSVMIYTIYGNEPNFCPVDRVEVDLNNFILPDEFAFAENVLFVLLN
jgi:hypothetical protein